MTIEAGLVTLGAAIYSIETYLFPALFLNDGNPGTVAAVFCMFALFYLAVFVGFRSLR